MESHIEKDKNLFPIIDRYLTDAEEKVADNSLNTNTLWKHAATLHKSMDLWKNTHDI